MSKIKVAIIILNWNGFEVTRECLHSLLQIKDASYAIVVVDNGSVDGSVEKLSQSVSNGQIDILALPKNLGFTGGNNEGIKYALSKYSPDFLLLLNNDTTVEKDFLTLMLSQFSKDKDCFAAVPKIVYYDRPDLLWFAGGRVSRLTGIVKHYGIDKKDSKQYDIPGPTEFMNGCCALISKEAISTIGLLDNQFFANSEDADYSLRIIDSGHTIQYVPGAKIYHKVNHSFKSNKGKWLAFYLAARGIVLLQKKHLKYWQLPIFFAVFLTRWVFYLTLKLLYLRDIKSIFGIYKGTWDGIQNRIRFVV